MDKGSRSGKLVAAKIQLFLQIIIQIVAIRPLSPWQSNTTNLAQLIFQQNKKTTLIYWQFKQIVSVVPQ